MRGERTGDYQNISQEIAELKRHANSVDIIITQAYQLDNKGTLWGRVNPRLYQFTRAEKIHLMPMVTNEGYDQSLTHRLLISSKARRRAIDNLLEVCKKYKYYGIQIDFENVYIDDRNYLTEFYTELAKALHKNGFKISIALFPLTSNIPPTTALKRLYNNWAYAYNYKALGEASDFVSIMAYNQHGGVTTPGPSAGIPWVRKVIEYSLQYIPANKISLGIPSYSTYWHMVERDKRNHSLGADISFKTAADLIKKNNAQVMWDASQGVNYTFYNRNQFNE
ncbi:MAG: glycosyl hydrolase family 18 protein, partial [Pseudomonadota bacterium]